MVGGYSEKTRAFLCRSRTYDLVITSSDALSLGSWELQLWAIKLGLCDNFPVILFGSELSKWSIFAIVLKERLHVNHSPPPSPVNEMKRFINHSTIFLKTVETESNQMNM